MVIDFHVHAFNPIIAEIAVSKLQSLCGQIPYTRGLTEQTVQRFDEWGVDKGVLLSIATKPTQQKVVNDWAAKQDNDRFLPFGSIHPDADDWYEELVRIKELGLHGIKLHPDYQGFEVDEQRMDKIYDAIADLDLPVIFHAGWDCVSPNYVHCKPENSARMAKKHKNLKMIFAHLGGNMRWQEVLDNLAGVDGKVYLDTSFSSNCPDDVMEKIIKQHGAERILFASDCPWDNSLLIKEKIDRLNLNDKDKTDILGNNAVKLLGI